MTDEHNNRDDAVSLRDIIDAITEEMGRCTDDIVSVSSDDPDAVAVTYKDGTTLGIAIIVKKLPVSTTLH